MWGNWQGWLISLVMVVAMAMGFAHIAKLDRMTPPTALSADAANLAVLTLPPVSLEQLGGIAPRNDETPDAAALDYTAAISAYLSDPSTYDRIAAGSLPTDFETLPAIAAILRAAQCSEATTILGPTAGEVITFKSSRPSLEAITVLGNVLISAGMMVEEADHDIARRYYSAAFTLGAALIRERLVYAELTAGTAMMTSAATRFAKLGAGNAATIQSIETFDAARRNLLQKQVAPIWQVIASVDPTVVSTHAGDVLVFARDSRERLWRVEACLALGRFKFAAPRPRDRAAAQRLLSQLSASTNEDSIVKLAAGEGQKLTIEEFRMLR